MLEAASRQISAAKPDAEMLPRPIFVPQESPKKEPRDRRSVLYCFNKLGWLRS